MRKLLLGLGFGLAAAAVAQGQGQAPGAPANLQATRDPRYQDVIAKCRTPPPAPAPRGGGAGRAGGGAGRGAAATGQGRGAAQAGPAEYTVTAIPGVIAAGQRWTSIYQTTGNNADGMIASEDGGVLIAQNDNGMVVKLDPKGQATIVHRNTNTGGALAKSTKGALFVVSRGIGTAVTQLEPQRRVFANSFNGDPLECLGGVINDVTADSRGGVYFTMGGLFHASAKGVVTQHGKDLRTNGVLLSADEKTVYVTNQQSVAAFDVQPDGSLSNQRDFAKLSSGAGDGMALDAAGRLYVTSGGGPGGSPGVHIFSADGKPLGVIPSSRNLITVVFSGPEKKTLFAVANDQRNVDVYTIPMLAQGPPGRAK